MHAMVTLLYRTLQSTLGYDTVIRRTWAMAASRNIAFKIAAKPGLSTLISLKSPSVVLVVISNMSVPICNRFHSRRASSGKIASPILQVYLPSGSIRPLRLQCNLQLHVSAGAWASFRKNQGPHLTQCAIGPHSFAVE